MSTAVKKEPAAPAEKPLERIKDQLALAKSKLAEVAPAYMNVDRLTRLLLAACGRSPKILACTPESILQFSMKCAETGLEPIGAGGCWPIPYENRKAGTVELTFLPDYRGLVHCAVRGGCIKSAFAEVVRAGDEFDYELGLEPSLMHKPCRGDRGDLEAAYCVFQLANGEKRFTVMHRQEICDIRKRSRAANSGPWVTDESEMWKKTVIRRAMKPFAGMSSHLDAAINADDDAAGAIDNGQPKELVTMPRAVGEIPVEEMSKVNGLATKQQLESIDRLCHAKKVAAAAVAELVTMVGASSLTMATEQQAGEILANLEEVAGE